jgi:hypothetical protein
LLLRSNALPYCAVTKKVSRRLLRESEEHAGVLRGRRGGCVLLGGGSGGGGLGNDVGWLLASIIRILENRPQGAVHALENDVHLDWCIADCFVPS